MAIHKKPISMRDVPSVRQLRTFVAVYHAGNLSLAAEALALTQPAVTVLLRELEARLGVRLFDRTTRSLQRTDAALEAIEYAERILAELDALGAGMSELSGARRGRVRIAATSTIAQTLLPKALRRYLDLYPGVKVVVDDCAPGQFVEKIVNDQVDFGVGTLEAGTPGLQEKVFLRDHLSVIADRSVRFRNPASVSWKQLAGMPLVTVRPGYGVRRSIDQAAAAAGVGLTIRHEVALLGTALAMAASGLGVSILPASILAHAGYPNLVARHLVRPVVVRNIAVVYRQGRTLAPAAAAFADLLAREFGQN
jgi:LysR family carnitine catabolism transcriptional activator